MVLIGIDPGSAGGIASYDTESKEFKSTAMPKTDLDIKNYLISFTGELIQSSEVYVLMEKVGGFIGTRKTNILINCPYCHCLVPYQKEEGDPGSTMFKFGDGNGFLRGVCITMGYGYETIAPRSWQKIHNIYKARGMSKTQWKNILKDRAQKLFPQLKVTLSTADALLILDVLIRMKVSFVKN